MKQFFLVYREEGDNEKFSFSECIRFLTHYTQMITAQYVLIYGFSDLHVSLENRIERIEKGFNYYYIIVNEKHIKYFSNYFLKYTLDFKP